MIKPWLAVLCFVGAFLFTSNISVCVASTSPTESYNLGYKTGKTDGDYDGYQTGKDANFKPAYHWALDTSIDLDEFSENLRQYVYGYRAGYEEGFAAGKARAEEEGGGDESGDYKDGYDDGYADATAGKSYNPFEDNGDPSVDYLNGYHEGYFSGTSDGTENEAFKAGYKIGYPAGVLKGSSTSETSTEESLVSANSSETADFIRGLKSGYADGLAHAKETMTISSKVTRSDGTVIVTFSDQSLKQKGFDAVIFYFPHKIPDMWVEMIPVNGQATNGTQVINFTDYKQVIWNREEKTSYTKGEKWVSSDGRIHWKFEDGSWYQYDKNTKAWTRYDATHRVMWNSQGDVFWYHSDGKRCIFYSRTTGVKYYILGKEVTKAEYDSYDGTATTTSYDTNYKQGYNAGWVMGYGNTRDSGINVIERDIENFPPDQQAYYKGMWDGYQAGLQTRQTLDKTSEDYQRGYEEGFAEGCATIQAATGYSLVMAISDYNSDAEQAYWAGRYDGYQDGLQN
ncbi:MAG: hypothetical protein ACOY3I_10375 [Verrucomicrobiota bacterium]